MRIKMDNDNFTKNVRYILNYHKKYAPMKKEKTMPKSPFFIEATSETLDQKLLEYGIITPPRSFYRKTSDGKRVELFMHKEGNKHGWMVHIVDPVAERRFNKRIYGRKGYAAYHKWQDD